MNQQDRKVDKRITKTTKKAKELTLQEFERWLKKFTKKYDVALKELAKR